MRFVVDSVAPGQIFLKILQDSPVSIIPPILHTHLRLHVARRTHGQSSESSKKQRSHGNRAAVDRKVFSLFLVFEGLTSMFYNFRAWRPRGGLSFILPQLRMFGSCRNSLVPLSFHVSVSWAMGKLT